MHDRVDDRRQVLRLGLSQEAHVPEVHAEQGGAAGPGPLGRPAITETLSPCADLGVDAVRVQGSGKSFAHQVLGLAVRARKQRHEQQIGRAHV